MIKRAFWGVFLVAVLLSVLGCEGVDNESSFWIQFIDVGDGDAALVQCDGHYMLIDGGPKGAKEKVYSIVDDALKADNTHMIDYIIISHPHEDHVSAIPQIINSYKVGRILSNVNAKNIARSAYSELKSDSPFYKVLDSGYTVICPQRGEKYKLGSASVEVLFSPFERENDSLIILITYGKNTFLFPGDNEVDTENDFCNKYPDDEFPETPVTLLKVPHHGSNTSLSIRFLSMIMPLEMGPKYAIITTSKGQRHPTETTLSRLEQDDIEYYRTDLDGDIYVFSDGTDIDVKTHFTISK